MISTYYLIIMKNYFASLPPSLEEAARIDGANEFVVLTKIYIPISKPFMATFALFYAVERWNGWWEAFLYISDKNIKPLQIYLRDILVALIPPVGKPSAVYAYPVTRCLFNLFRWPQLSLRCCLFCACIHSCKNIFVKGVMIRFSQGVESIIVIKQTKIKRRSQHEKSKTNRNLRSAHMATKLACWMPSGSPPHPVV